MNRSVHKDTCSIWDRGVCNCGPINAAPESRDAGGAASGGQGDAKKEACCYRPFWCKDVSGCLSMGCRRIGQTKAEREADLNAHSAGFICAEDMHADRSASQGAPTPPAHSADSDGGASKQDRQLVNQGRDEGMRAAFLAMQEAQTGGGEAVAPEAKADRAVFEQWYDAQPDGKLSPWDVWQSAIQHAIKSGHACTFALDNGGNLYRRYKEPQCAPPAPPAPPAPLPGKRERALFQAWDRHWNLSLRADGERYMSESTQEGWYAWKGRAALSSPPTLEAAPADYPPHLADEVERELALMIDRCPEPLRRLSDWLANKLDEDDWKTAERLLLGAVESAADRAQRSGVSADPLPDRVSLSLGPVAFQFTSHQQWVNKAQSWFANLAAENPNAARKRYLCIDAKGRVCMIGKDFGRARDEDAFPVKLYLIDAASQHQVKKGEPS